MNMPPATEPDQPDQPDGARADADDAPPAPTPPAPTPPARTAPAPLLPTQSREDTDVGWGEYRERDDDDDRLIRDRPPHWDNA